MKLTSNSPKWSEILVYSGMFSPCFSTLYYIRRATPVQIINWKNSEASDKAAAEAAERGDLEEAAASKAIEVLGFRISGFSVLRDCCLRG